jgi:hypothetical protein
MGLLPLNFRLSFYIFVQLKIELISSKWFARGE